MSHLTAAKLILAASGLIVWGFGIRTDEEMLQYVGIGLMVTAVLLRFLRRPDLDA